MIYLICFLLGAFSYSIITKYVVSSSIERKVLFYKKHAYYIRDIGRYNISSMPEVVKKVNLIEYKIQK